MFWLKILTKELDKMSWIVAVFFIVIPHGEYFLYKIVSLFYGISITGLFSLIFGQVLENIVVKTTLFEKSI